MAKKKKKKVLKTEDNSYCNNQSVPWLVGDFSGQKKRVISKARCKLWTCPYCAELNRQQHFNRIANGLQSLNEKQVDMSFVTITCHENWRGNEQSIRNWRRNKDKLLARFRRKYKKEYGKSGYYVYIPETHKDGSLHIHGIFSGDFGNRWWKDNARSVGLGFMAESEKLKTVLQGTNYCLKYITKQIGFEVSIKNFRRVNYSQGFPDKQAHVSDGQWRMLERDESIKTAIVEGILKKGFTVRFDRQDFKSLDDL